MASAAAGSASVVDILRAKFIIFCTELVVSKLIWKTLTITTSFTCGENPKPVGLHQSAPFQLQFFELLSNKEIAASHFFLK